MIWDGDPAEWRQGGIYAIICNGRIYVGQARDFQKRWHGHRGALRAGRHPNWKLQASWNKYGEETFVFSVLEVAPVDQRTVLEARWAVALHAFDRGWGFNIAPISSDPDAWKQMAQRSSQRVGVPRPPEVIARISAAQIGKFVSEETKELIRQARSRQPSRSAESRAKTSAALANRLMTLETRKKGAASHLGSQHTEATKAVMRAKKLGRQMTDQQKRERAEKMVAGNERSQALEPILARAIETGLIADGLWEFAGYRAATRRRFRGLMVRRPLLLLAIQEALA